MDMHIWAEKMRCNFHAEIIRRGWVLYKQASVRGLNRDDEGVIKAQVIAHQLYKVSLNATTLTDGSCNCPFGDHCEHMAALVFEASKQLKLDPKELLTLAAEQPSNKRWSDASSRPAPIVPAKPKSKPKPDAQPSAALISKPQEQETPLEWHAYFESQFKTHSFSGLFNVDSIVENVNRKLLPIADSWRPINRAFYQLHVQLFTMKFADGIYDRVRGAHYYYNYAALFARIATPALEQVVNLIAEINGLQNKEQYPRHLTESAEYLAKHALKEQGSSCMHWLDVYRVMWWSLLDQSEARQQEHLRLQNMLNRASVNPRECITLVMACAHFAVMDNRDQEAMQFLEQKLDLIDPGDLLGYLQTFADTNEGERLLSWLRWLKPYVRRSTSDYVEVYFHYWDKALELLPLEEEWKEAAVSFLPDSFYIYEGGLLHRGLYKEWVDLCLYMNLSPFDTDRADLKLVEQEDPRLLLPLYHTAVERFIQEKNRNSYKLAVHLLKKLKGYYKKLKEQKRWEFYIEYMSRQYSRYRAFQEELQKGKLLA